MISESVGSKLLNDVRCLLTSNCLPGTQEMSLRGGEKGGRKGGRGRRRERKRRKRKGGRQDNGWKGRRKAGGKKN